MTVEEFCRKQGCPELLQPFRRLLDRIDAVGAVLDYGPGQTRAPSALVDKIKAGRFRPLSFHAAGGLGLIFAAEDGELGRTVALKCMRDWEAPDSAAKRRFMLEAEVTAQLEHPGIVPVYGMGQDQAGRPYYAMRLVGGTTLSETVKRLHAQGRASWSGADWNLEFRRLLQNLIVVCQTIAYSHSRGVIHRDIKPANIMLGPYGETLVLDWGLAKRLESGDGDSTVDPACASIKMPVYEQADLTIQQMALGTPTYMSPEQAAGDWDRVGKASDIYSLGASLYLLLTGKTAYEGGKLEVLAKAKAGTFARPRQINPKVPRALEAICLKAMAFRPEDRYLSAKELASDLERWLGDEPIQAYWEPIAVRALRWLRRHRTVVASAAAAVLVALIALGALTGVLSAANERLDAASRSERAARIEAIRERDEAQRQSQRADRNLARARQAVDDYCTSVAEDRRLKQQDQHELRKKLLETAVPFYEEFVAQKGDDPALRADQGLALLRLARLRSELGDKKRAASDFGQAANLFAALVASQPNESTYLRELSDANRGRGVALAELGQWTEAEKALRQALQMGEQLASRFPGAANYRQDLAKCQNNLGDLLSDLGRRKDAEQAYGRAIEIRQRLAADFPAVSEYRAQLGASYNNLGILLSDLGRQTEADKAYRKSVELRERLVTDHPDVPEHRRDLAGSYDNLGLLLADLGSRVDAEKAYRRALELQQRLVERYPSVPQYRLDLARTHNNLGIVSSDLDRPSESQKAYEKSIDLYDRLTAEFPAIPEYRQELARTHNNLGNLAREYGRLAEAKVSYEKALAIYARLLTDSPKIPGYALEWAMDSGDYAHLLRDDGHGYQALQWYDKALARLKILLDEDPRLQLGQEFQREFIAGKALTLSRSGRFAEAAALGEQLSKEKELSDDALYYTACTLSLCSTAKGSDPLLADKTIKLLQKAQAAGYFDVSVRQRRLRSSKDLDGVRSREAFKKLLADLETKKPKAGGH
jgi:serine/threonine-protein kinase